MKLDYLPFKRDSLTGPVLLGICPLIFLQPIRRVDFFRLPTEVLAAFYWMKSAAISCVAPSVAILTGA